MNMQLVNEITKSQIKTDVPQFKAGDTLKVFVKIQEGNKTRLQMFEGVCIAKKGHGIGETFTVRKISYGVADFFSWKTNNTFNDIFFQCAAAYINDIKTMNLFIRCHSRH